MLDLVSVWSGFSLKRSIARTDGTNKSSFEILRNIPKNMTSTVEFLFGVSLMWLVHPLLFRHVNSKKESTIIQAFLVSRFYHTVVSPMYPSVAFPVCVVS